MTAEQRAGLSDAALAMTQPCIDELIKDISRRVQKAGAITDTAEYQIYRAQALGEGKKAIEQAVSKQIGISEEVIASLFEYVADKSLSPDENGSLKRMTEAYTRMTQSKTRELLRDLWADTPDGKVQPLQTAYARAMDFAFRQVATGTLDLNTAIRRAVTPLAKRGLRTIEQKSGRSVGIEYACRRYIMDQLGQLDDEIQHADHDALGCDGWEISAHAACAPDHEPIQGRQYGDAEFEKLNNSLQRRIGHLNCGHTAKANAEAAKDAQEAAESARDAASGSASAAAGLASAAASSASAAASAAKTAGDAAAKVVNEGVAEKLTEMQNIQKDVSTKAQTAETAAKNADTAKTAAQNAQKAAEKSAGNAANSESAAKTSAEQAAAARDTAQELAGRVIVDDALSDTSASPVQNKVIFAALAKKQDVQRVTFVINDTDGGLDAVVAD